MLAGSPPFQSTLPRGERLYSADEHLSADVISIHAPARGATIRAIQHARKQLISIHAPARGATRRSPPKKSPRKFQSTLPRGERRSFRVHARSARRISIHAPARGATGLNLLITFGEVLFQSTLPRGERQRPLPPSANRQRISIHAPARGATTSRYVGCHAHCISIHAPARGATADKRIDPKQVWEISIHAPARGATGLPRYTYKYIGISIHAPARGATNIDYDTLRVRLFQSTLPRGERHSTNHYVIMVA